MTRYINYCQLRLKSSFPISHWTPDVFYFEMIEKPVTIEEQHIYHSWRPTTSQRKVEQAITVWGFNFTA